MSNNQLHKPARVERAWERLDKALGRLDAALQARGAADPQAEQALAEAEAENARLRDAADDLSRRLDGTISRLRAVLEA